MLAFSDNIPNISNKQYICKHLSFHLLKHSYSSSSHPMLFEDTHFYIYCSCRILMIVFCECGFKAISQSDTGLIAENTFDFSTKTSILPHKTIAMLSGLGYIGKNNLFITTKYGAAQCLGSVLTNAPLTAYIRMEALYSVAY